MLIVGNGTIITRDNEKILDSSNGILIDGKFIKEVGNLKIIKEKFPEASFIDAKGMLIMPGMINTHMHIYSSFARGMDSKSTPPKDFLQILEGLWWKLDRTLTLEDIKYSALVTYLDLIKNGTTTIFDHHASAGAVTGSLFTIAEAAKALNVRSSLCYEVSDRDGEEIMLQGINENVDFIKYANSLKDDMLTGMFGLHASFTLSDKTLDLVKEKSDGLNSGFHIHAAEGILDEEESESKYGKRVIERLNDFNILGEKTLAIHCTHINEREMEIIKSTNTTVVHNPESNMGNAVGCSPAIDMMKKGITVGLGTDGYTCDMFESMKTANILHKHNLKDPSAAWAEVPRMLFENNRIITERHIKNKIGILKEGAIADIIIADYTPHTPLTEDNINFHILFGVSGRCTETSIINGKVVMKDREILGIDQERIYSKSTEISKKLWDRI
ncbi:MAG: putative aminohydrolase SsnA [Clostridiaceae bacterium]